MKTTWLRLTLITAAALALAVAGCSDSTNPEASGVGRIQLSLIDAPGDYDAVNVHVIGVRVHRGDAEDSNSGWFDVSSDSSIVDLLTLTNGNVFDLADSTLPAGYYTQIRLMLGDSNTVVVDGETFDLEVPSGSQTGLKLNHPFSIEGGGIYQATLDFDADRSVHRTGNGRYMLKPVIRVIVDQTAGTLIGIIDPASARAKVWTVAGPDTATAWADTMTGGFGFAMLPAGTYDLHVEATAGAWRDTVVTGAVVEAGHTVSVGTIALQPE